MYLIGSNFQMAQLKFIWFQIQYKYPVCFLWNFGSCLSVNYLLLYGPSGEKTCLWRVANNTGVDQPAHPHSQISAFVIRLLESIIYRLATSEISIF